MRACGSRLKRWKQLKSELYHLCAPERIRHQVSHVSSLLVVASSSHFSSTTARSTLDSAIFSETTLYSNKHFRKDLFRLFQKLLYRKATPGRKAALKNRSRTSTTRLAETCEQTVPQVLSPKCLRPENLRQFR